MDDQDLMTARLIINDKCNKIEKLEGWLKYLWVLYWQEHDGELLGAVENKEIDAEISDYIKAMEVKP